jgi:sigma-B regulation protein RsbU (phosphoserine phosphatase)
MSPRNPFSRLFGENDSNGSTEAALRKEIDLLQKSVESLSILNDLTLAMTRTIDPEKAVEKLINRSMRAVNAEQATVKLLGRDKDNPLETRIDINVSSAEHMAFRVDDTLLGWMLLQDPPQTLVLNDPGNDEKFRGVAWDKSIRSVICLPLTAKSELFGILTLYNKRGETGFTGDDTKLLSVIGANAAQILENTRLIKQTNRMQEQLNLAAEIQATLLPDSPPRIAGYDIAGASKPAQNVGGDYYDWIPVDDTRLAVCLGDVSGKGLPASLIMANVQATVRGQTLINSQPHERIARSNTLLCRSIDDEHFVTMWYCVLDAGTHELVYCSAGHEHPFLVSADGGCTRLDQGGLALGVFEDMGYEQKTVCLQPDDVIVIFSDGVTDATTVDNKSFGEERLHSVIVDHRTASAQTIVEAIFSAVEDHAGNAAQFDDLTVVVVKRTS